MWKCRCDCGNEYVATAGTLRYARSCKRCSGLKDIVGKRFGKLTVIRHVYDKKNRHAYECLCDCGRKAVYVSSALLRGKATTCQHCSDTVFTIENGVATGRTANGALFLFDADDWEIVTCRNWTRTSKGYIVSGEGENRAVLHRLVMNAPSDLQVDHINRNKADCRKSNLRLTVNALNAANAAVYSDNQSTGHKNVYMVEGRYRVAVRKHGHLKHFGRYGTLEEAIEVANEKRKILFGEFAYHDPYNDERAAVSSRR